MDLQQSKEEKILSFIAQVLQRISASRDHEESLFFCLKKLVDDFGCIDASIYIIDRERKNGYIIVNARDTKLRNIPFTVKAKPEISNFYEPDHKSVLEQLKEFEKGVYKFEELVKILVPIVSNQSCLLLCELINPSNESIQYLLKVSQLLALIMKDQVEKTEIYKLLYGVPLSESIARDQRDRTLSELAGSVAHLLNQPLTSLMGYVELLIKRGDFKPEGATFLNKIYNEAERLADIIKKIEAVNSYETEEYIGSTKILKLDEAIQSEVLPTAVKGSGKEKRVAKKLETFLDLYKGINQSKSRGEIMHHFAFSINRMFPDLRLLLLYYRESTSEFNLEYKEKGGYSRDFELSPDKIKFYRKILDELNLKIFRFDEKVAHIITIPLVIEDEKLGIAEYDFEKEEISLFDIIILEAMTSELVIALYKLKLAEKNRYLKDYLSNLIENTASIIFTIDEEYSIRTCNPAFEDVIGITKANLEGRKFTSMLIEDELRLERITKSIDECFGGKVVKKLDVSLLKENKEHIDASFSLIPLPKVKNLKPEIMAIGQNITEIKELENQVMQSEKLAYLGQMAACVAHELNNPLTSITVFTEYIQKRLQGEIPDKYGDYKDKLDRIIESSNRIQSFSRNLTSFAQPSEGSNPETVDVNNIIKESLLFADYEIDKEKVMVEYQLAESLPEATGFRSQLHQVFINLVANASHALNEKGGRITIKTSDHDDDYIKVDVMDDGEGMEPKVLDRVFEPFFSTRKGSGGTGLGLTIVKKIIDNHKGKIEIKSEPGKGTTFSILLPK